MLNTRSEKRAYLDEEIADWRKRLERAFLKVVNTKRRAHNQTPFSSTTLVHLPRGENANLFLLTLKVWCVKYHVTPEWMLEQLMWLYRNRRPPDDGPNQINLGIAAPVLVGTVARNFIEERIKLEFPNDENIKSQSTPIPREIEFRNLDFSLPETLETYIEAIQKERKVFDRTLKCKQTRIRSYRVF